MAAVKKSWLPHGIPLLWGERGLIAWSNFFSFSPGMHSFIAIQVRSEEFATHRSRISLKTTLPMFD